MIKHEIFDTLQGPPMHQRKIIYEDDEVRVIYQEGDSNFIFVTFGDLFSIANGVSFFADKPVTKLGLNCIGVMAKRANWFPERNITDASLAINGILCAFGEVILYGGSMGGYGCLKYSRKLNATKVISLCPQWSISPDECGSTPSGYQRFYTPTLKNMGITSSDLAGDIYVFYDQYHPRDSFHARKILDLKQNLNSMDLPYAAHSVTTMLAGTENLSNILHAVIQENVAELRVFTNRIRRKSPYRAKNLLTKSLKRHPIITYKILSSSSFRKFVGEKMLKPLDVLAFNHFSTSPHIFPSLFLRSASRIKKEQYTLNQFRLLIGDNSSNFIKSCYNHIICYSIHTNSLVQQPLTNPMLIQFGFFPVSLKNREDRQIITVANGTAVFVCQINEDGTVLLADQNKALHENCFFEVSDCKSGYSLKFKQTYMTVPNALSVSFNAQAVKKREIFAFESDLLS